MTNKNKVKKLKNGKYALSASKKGHYYVTTIRDTEAEVLALLPSRVEQEIIDEMHLHYNKVNNLFDRLLKLYPEKYTLSCNDGDKATMGDILC